MLGAKRVANTPKKAESKIMTEKLTQAQELVALAEDCELFHNSEFSCFATLEAAGGHFETWPIRSATFKRWLLREFYEATSKPPGNQALEDTLRILEAKAQFDGQAYPVYKRVASCGDRIYIDLVNEAWEVVEISVDGWKVLRNSPLKFTRAPGMMPLPRPLSNGDVTDLRRILNCTSDRNWILIVAWMLAALRPKGPYPIMVVLAEHGAGKTTLMRFLRSLVDPSSVPVRAAPRNEEDLMIAACNSWVIALDNLSWMPNWLSDALCRLATGGGLTKRKLYTDAAEQLLDAQRPIILNSIEAIAERTDLVDRAIFVELGQIPDSERRAQVEIEKEFKRLGGRILGAFLTAVSAGLKNLPSVNLGSLPRMADFATWVTACEPALGWRSGQFLQAYNSNRSGAVEKALEVDLIASAIRKLMSGRSDWQGTATELLDSLEKLADERTRKAKGWPKIPLWLSRKMKRSVTFLREIGIEIVFPADGDKPRLIRIRQGLQNAEDSAGAAETRTSTDSPARANAAATHDRGNDATELKPSTDGGSALSLATRGKKQRLSNSSTEDSMSQIRTPGSEQKEPTLFPLPNTDSDSESEGFEEFLI